MPQIFSLYDPRDPEVVDEDGIGETDHEDILDDDFDYDDYYYDYVDEFGHPPTDYDEDY